jgi:hypothetical protein
LKLFDSSELAKEDLDKIVTAFIDLADGMKVHDFACETGMYDQESEQNFADAQKAALKQYAR